MLKIDDWPFLWPGEMFLGMVVKLIASMYSKDIGDETLHLEPTGKEGD